MKAVIYILSQSYLSKHSHSSDSAFYGCNQTPLWKWTITFIIEALYKSKCHRESQTFSPRQTSRSERSSVPPQQRLATFACVWCAWSNTSIFTDRSSIRRLREKDSAVTRTCPFSSPFLSLCSQILCPFCRIFLVLQVKCAWLWKKNAKCLIQHPYTALNLFKCG